MRLNRLISANKHFIAAHRRNPLIKALAKSFTSFLNAYHNLDYEHEHNGELDVLQAMARCEDVRTVFDVGANVGDWFILAAQFFPNARIHAFEILEDVCKRAAERASDPRITVHNLGLADHHGTIDILYNPSNSALSSAYHLDGRSGELTVQAPVTTGDRFMREHGLQRVDFLKLDVEGMEHKVLAGFQEAVDAGRIGAVQFEYGMVNIITRFLLRDFFNYFKERGYLLGKIYPGYVDFRDYKLKDEDFRGPNFLAVHESRTRLLEALQGHG